MKTNTSGQTPYQKFIELSIERTLVLIVVKVMHAHNLGASFPIGQIPLLFLQEFHYFTLS